jgi:hypothetical protein
MAASISSVRLALYVATGIMMLLRAMRPSLSCKLASIGVWLTLSTQGGSLYMMLPPMKMLLVAPMVTFP